MKGETMRPKELLNKLHIDLVQSDRQLKCLHEVGY
jgi:hypothetical protein